MSLGVSSQLYAQPSYQPSEENLKAREEFQDNKFGIFLHWGLYAMLATGEWTMTNNNLNYKENAKLAGAPRLAPPREKTGSTDFGNVMYEIPGSCIRVAFVPEGTSSHSQEFVDAGKTQAARDCILYGAKSIAGASMDLITKPELMDEVKAEFAENKKKFK